MTKNMLTTKIFKKNVMTNFLSSFLIMALSTVYIHTTWKQYFMMLLFWLVVTTLAQFTIAPFTHRLISSSINEKLNRFEKGTVFSSKERTEFMEEIMNYPVKKGLESFFVFFIGCIALVLSCYFLPFINLDVSSSAGFAMGCAFGTYSSSLMSFAISEKVCIDYGQNVFIQGVDREYILHKKHFGISDGLRCILFLILPEIFGNFLLFFCLRRGYSSTESILPPITQQIIRMVVLTVMIAALCISMAVIYYHQVNSSIRKLRKTTTLMLSNAGTATVYPTALNDTMQYNLYLMNSIVYKFNSMIAKASKISDDIQQTTEELSNISQNVSTTSINQNIDVDEILHTVRNTNELSSTIEKNISDVNIRIEQTNQDVKESFTTLDESIRQIEKIQETNQLISKGISTLAQHIYGIDDVVAMIKDIADQTRIIAFNAELEAVSAKNEGKNFHIVATEIQRLANSTMNSIQEIQSYIQNIKNAGKDLTECSRNSTSYIQEENEITSELRQHFKSIQESAQNTAAASIEIQSIVNQQATSFSQIVTTLTQISAGFKNFTESTKQISIASQDMNRVSSILSKIGAENN